MRSSDFLIVGGGVAGLSAAHRLLRHGTVTLIEAEAALGYHSSGRSVTFSHFGIGDAVVRGLTAHSRAFFESPPDGFSAAPLCRRQGALWAATEAMTGALEALRADMAPYVPLEDLDSDGVHELCPILKAGEAGFIGGIADRSGLKLDADALLQAYAKAVKTGGGQIALEQRIAAVTRSGSAWEVTAKDGTIWSSPVLINAAGAWADRVAALAGVEPLGLRPLRRTIIVVDAPGGTDARDWPFVHTAIRDFYIMPEAGRLLVSPVDEIAADPCDAQPEEYDVAVTAAKLEDYTSLRVHRIRHSWAGLRTFTADRVPTAGFAPDAQGFFWLAGQGGYGLQTAPAMSEITEALITGGTWPNRLTALDVTPEKIRPERLTRATKSSQLPFGQGS